MGTAAAAAADDDDNDGSGKLRCLSNNSEIAVYEKTKQACHR